MDTETNPQQQSDHQSEIKSQQQPQPESTTQNVQQNQMTEVRKTSQYKADLEWDIQNFNEQDAIKQFSKLANYNHGIDQIKQHQKLHITQSHVKTIALVKVFSYTLKGQNADNSQVQIVRKYSDFYALREALVRRWPGCYVPPVPEKGNIGTTEKQIIKNKLFVVNNFLSKVIESEHFCNGEELKVFIGSSENEVEKSLDKLKSHSLEDLYGLYKSSFPHIFQNSEEQFTNSLQQKIKAFQNYFGDKKQQLAKEKDDIKRLAELRTKLTILRYQVLEKTLPEYESICLGWFDGKTAQKIQIKKQKPEIQKQENKEQQPSQPQKHEDDSKKIYSSKKYQNALEAYKDDLFPQEEGENEDWLIYELFKFELREIEAILQAITNFKSIDTERKYYQRNIEANKTQLEDLEKKKLSLKIILLSGSEDDKKLHINHQNQILQTNFKLVNELWGAITYLLGQQIEKFEVDRCKFYKQSLMKAFKKEAVYMGKLFNLYVEIHKLRQK